MKISAETVEHIAHLARLTFEGDQKDAIRTDLNNIVEFMDKLSEVDTHGVEPLIFMTEGYDHLREDEINVVISQDDALKNAPKKDSDYFRIPKVLEK
jgi:aspartyl-tRNA(Asn)/glutamyl-tRNA(Gln) amidotransferase subunit C